MSTTSRGFRVLRSSAKPHSSSLGGFVDSLIQTFENCRAGLSDDVSLETAETFFADVYQKELSRLAEMISTVAPDLSRARAEAFYREIDNLIRKVVIPAYSRIAARFTVRERNGFYLVRERMHGVERAGWALAGIGMGVFAVKAPFIPLWAWEWVIPFMVGGLLFPDLRRYFAFRRYEREVNSVVANADAEIDRMYTAHLVSEHAPEAVPADVVRDSEGVPNRSQKDRVH